MAAIKKCDICGTNYDPADHNHIVQLHDCNQDGVSLVDPRTFDVCSDCMEKVSNFIDSILIPPVVAE